VSAEEIITELTKLTPAELEQVDAKLHELMRPTAKPKHWGEALLEVAGTVKGLPADYAHNHDHYLHGAPKKQ